MGIKYTIPFKSYDDKSWRADILSDVYTDAPITCKGVQGQILSLSYDGDTDDPYSSFINSKLTLNLYNEGQIDVNELQQGQDKDFIIRVYRENILKWTGFLITEGIQYPFKNVPYTLQLTATDGLSMLKDIPFNASYKPPGLTFETSWCPLNYIRLILFYQYNLNLPLPIRWTNTLQCTAFPNEDMFAGSVQWAVDGQAYTSYQDENLIIKTCEDILKGILESAQCRIYQADGRWNIRRINDICSGSFNYKQIPADLGILLIQTGSENVLSKVGRFGYNFINEDQLITTKSGIKTCKVTYNETVRENILPNGNQDITIFTSLITPIDKIPIYWGYYETNIHSGILSVPALDGRASGYATQIEATGTPIYFTLKTTGGTLGSGGLPVDTQTIVKKINFGFLFSPVLGFGVDGNGFIIWTDTTFLIRVIFNVDNNVYYLNKFGFWQANPVYIPITVDGLKLNDIAKIDFDAFQGIIMPTPDNPPVAGSTSDIQIEFVVNAQKYILDNIYINIENGNDIYESTLESSKNTLIDERELAISSSFGGYILSNYMTDWSKSDTECFFKDGLIYEGTLTGLTANAIMRYRYKSSHIFNGSINVRNSDWSFNEMYLIDTFNNTVFLPLNATFNIEKSEVNIIAMECRNENPILVEKYYSSNDNQLSN